MRIGIIRYPGSNCDNDSLRFFKNSFYIWHTETKLPHMNLLVIPGGFAFGDRVYEKATDNYIISPGEMAIKSPVTQLIYEAIKLKIPIIGICNGFQILTKLHLLPGKLEKNSDLKFHSKYVDCTVKTDFFGNDELSGKKVTIPIANSFGNYQVEQNDIKDHQIFMTYDNHKNGSFRDIAGVCNEDHTIYGFMPHIERMRDDNVFSDVITKIVNSLRYDIDAVMNSEHVSYKSTRKYLSKLYTEGEHVVQGPGENAGIIELDSEYCLALRIESHNHPIYINPYEGAKTGVGGILRDIFTMGARPIALFDFLHFGTDKRSETLIDETIRGISDYGNCIGVPVVGGDFYRDDTYNQNPLLNVACLGLVKKENIIYGHANTEYLSLVYVGAKTGREGVKGAEMASNSFGDDVSNLEDNVQTGDAFLEKLLLEACCEIADLKLAHGMQDMGAGLLCATMEVVKRGRDKTNSNLGCVIDIEKVPIKYDMSTSDILLSETQERMLIVVESKNKKRVNEIFEKWDLEYATIGYVMDHGNYVIKRNGKIEYSKNYNDFPDPIEDWDLNECALQKYELEKNTELERWSVYDNTIGGRTIKGPLERGSYSILDIYEINKKLFVTWGSTFYECYNKVIEHNYKPLCVINCLNFGHPKNCMGTFSKCVEELAKDCQDNNVPVVGGNVSLYNSTNDKCVKGTVVLLMIGIEI